MQSILMSDPTEKLDPMSLLTYMSTGVCICVCVCVCVCVRACVLLHWGAWYMVMLKRRWL